MKTEFEKQADRVIRPQLRRMFKELITWSLKVKPLTRADYENWNAKMPHLRQEIPPNLK
jgi:hypothetical protein